MTRRLAPHPAVAGGTPCDLDERVAGVGDGVAFHRADGNAEVAVLERILDPGPVRGEVGRRVRRARLDEPPPVAHRQGVMRCILEQVEQLVRCLVSDLSEWFDNYVLADDSGQASMFLELDKPGK